MSSAYKILKIPVSKENTVYYYYKSFDLLDVKSEAHKERLVDIPKNRSLYVCHFMKPIEEQFIQKYFAQAGKIRQIHFGQYKNSANNKRKRRTIYFAIIVFKKAEDVARILADSKVLQKVVNKTLKKQIKFINEFDDDEDDEPEDDEDPEVVKRREMEDGGFTVVGVASNNLASKSKKHKVVDKDQTTTILGISQEEAKKAYEQSLLRGAPITGLTPEDYEAERARIMAERDQEEVDEALEQSNRLKREGLPSMYSPQKLSKREKSMLANKLMYSALRKDKKKEELEKLREEFERNKRRIAKQQAKLQAAQ